MAFGSSFDDSPPLRYVGGVPVYATTLLVAIHVATFLGTALLVGAKQDGLLKALSFSSTEVLSGSVWQLVTYAFVHSPDRGIWFAVEMLMLYWFGRQLEQFFGREAFLRMYGCLLVLTPVVLTLVGLMLPTELAGSSGLHFAVFIAFAALYPSVEMIFGIAAKWVALILLGIYTVQAGAYWDWAMLASLWVSAGAALLFVMHARGQILLPSLPSLFRRPKLRVLPSPAPRSRSRAPEAPDEVESIDPLLEKIAKSGMDSLTAKERARLEKAREALLKKGGR